jgi:hypothetical protein
MRPNRKHFSIGNKCALQAWKFKTGDFVIITTGRSASASEKKGIKGATGYIQAVNRNPRNPTVMISNITVSIFPGVYMWCMDSLVIYPWFARSALALVGAGRRSST